MVFAPQQREKSQVHSAFPDGGRPSLLTLQDPILPLKGGRAPSTARLGVQRRKSWASLSKAVQDAEQTSHWEKGEDLPAW